MVMIPSTVTGSRSAAPLAVMDSHSEVLQAVAVVMLDLMEAFTDFVDPTLTVVAAAGDGEAEVAGTAAAVVEAIPSKAVGALKPAALT